ncbi:MAG: hypothetical protein VYC67_02700 [Pseudomonadota bacterium]|nr:hypothetical protein [Pseudomonadota bacterium]
MIKKINLMLASIYAITLGIVEAFLNWGDWQYAPLWIVDYIIVVILLLAVFFFKGKPQKMFLLIGWAFSSGVMYMALFVGLESVTVMHQNILFATMLAFSVSVLGLVLSAISND